MKIWTKMKDKVKAFKEMTPQKQLIITIAIITLVCSVFAFISSQHIVLSIRYEDYAYENYTENRTNGYSFYTNYKGTFYTTHGIHPDYITVNYLFAPSEDLREAFENEHLTIADLQRLDFDYWFKAKDK